MGNTEAEIHKIYKLVVHSNITKSIAIVFDIILLIDCGIAPGQDLAISSISIIFHRYFATVCIIAIQGVGS